MTRSIMLSLFILSGCATASQPLNADYPEPPPIIRTTPPSAQESVKLNFGQLSFDDQVVRFGLNRFQPLIPDWSEKKSGSLLASWNPNRNGQKHPAVVLQHGGVGGPGYTEYGHGAWFKQRGYNVLVVDSFWSRGFIANWRKIEDTASEHKGAFSELGANTRARDAFAAALWLKDRPEVDPDRIFLIGGSQGGWSVLRAFTDEKSITERHKGLFRAGVAIYPVCWSWQRTPGRHGEGATQMLNPRLGPYYAPLLILTVGLEPPGSATDMNSCDPAIFSSASAHIRYPEQTHAFDAEPPPGQPRGRCWYSANPHWCGASGGRDASGNCKGSPKADMCEDTSATEVARQDMLRFIDQFK